MKSTMIIITIRLLSQFKMASVLMFLLEPKIPKFSNIHENCFKRSFHQIGSRLSFFYLSISILDLIGEKRHLASTNMKTRLMWIFTSVR